MPPVAPVTNICLPSTTLDIPAASSRPARVSISEALPQSAPPPLELRRHTSPETPRPLVVPPEQDQPRDDQRNPRSGQHEQSSPRDQQSGAPGDLHATPTLALRRFLR